MPGEDYRSDPEELKEAFYKLYEIISLLRSPEGCPWDRSQTPQTLRKNLIEEAYECIAAIDENNALHVREELGDIFLILILLARMNEEGGAFSLTEVMSEISAKLIRRHPHVFEKREATSIPEIIKNWDYIKEHIEGKKKTKGILGDMPPGLPPLEKALEIQKKAAKQGFDWESPEPVFSKLDEEVQELQTALADNNRKATEEEVGDILFTIVNIARHLHTDPSLALEKTNRKFVERFRKVEAELRKLNVAFENASLELLDSLWNKIKANEPSP
jgi:MazG family protein